MVAVEGLTTARLAILVDRFHLTLQQIANLTDRTIAGVYFHSRTSEGAVRIPIVLPEAPGDSMAQLELLRGILSPTEFDKVMKEAAEKYGEASGRP